MKRMFAILCVILSLIFCGTAFAEEVNDVTYTSATYSSRGYSISLMWEEGILEDDELREFILDAFFNQYSAIRETFGTTDDRTVTVCLTKGTENYISSEKGIYMSYEDLKNNERARNTLIWFFVNKVANGHPNPEQNPEIDALSLGFQYYAANTYAICPDALVWMPHYEDGQQLTDNGQVAAAFITWAAQNYGEMVPVRLNRVLHDGYYDHHDFWISAAGNTLENLWQQYAEQSAK